MEEKGKARRQQYERERTLEGKKLMYKGSNENTEENSNKERGI